MSEKVRYSRNKADLRDPSKYSNDQLLDLRDKYSALHQLHNGLNFVGMAVWPVLVINTPLWLWNASKDYAVRKEIYRRNTGQEVPGSMLGNFARGMRDFVFPFHPFDKAGKWAVRDVFERTEYEDLSTRFFPESKRDEVARRMQQAVASVKALY